LGRKGFEERGKEDKKLKQQSAISKSLQNLEKIETQLKQKYANLLDAESNCAVTLWNEIKSITQQQQQIICEYLGQKANEEIKNQIKKATNESIVHRTEIAPPNSQIMQVVTMQNRRQTTPSQQPSTYTATSQVQSCCTL